MLKQFLFLALTYLVLPPLARAHDLPCSLLLENYRQQKAGALSPPSTKLVFASVGARDVYNPTKPFQILFKGQRIQVLAARVEARD
ncbi:MAG: hypothetical protein ACXVA9_08720, partial [Bdellovibrionales bacterium]